MVGALVTAAKGVALELNRWTTAADRVEIGSLVSLAPNVSCQASMLLLAFFRYLMSSDALYSVSFVSYLLALFSAGILFLVWLGIVVYEVTVGGEYKGMKLYVLDYVSWSVVLL